MKFLFDFFPVLLLLCMYLWGESHPQAAQMLAIEYLGGLVAGGAIKATLAPVLIATASAMVASVTQITYLLIRRKKIDAMLWLSFAIISIFGAATIYFQDATFIQWKPTILYWCFAAVLLISQFLFKKNLIRTMMEKQFTLPNDIWPRLNLAWAFFFIVMGILNRYVALNYSFAVWATFKAFGATSLVFVFAIGQTVFLFKHMTEPK